MDFAEVEYDVVEKKCNVESEQDTPPIRCYLRDNKFSPCRWFAWKVCPQDIMLSFISRWHLRDKLWNCLENRKNQEEKIIIWKEKLCVYFWIQNMVVKINLGYNPLNGLHPMDTTTQKTDHYERLRDTSKTFEKFWNKRKMTLGDRQLHSPKGTYSHNQLCPFILPFHF